MSRDYITVIGDAYLDPLILQIEKLKGLSHGKTNEVQSSVVEHGYSASIIVLAVIFLESMFGRAGYFDKKNSDKRFRALDYFTELDGNSILSDKVRELFVVRDVIAHNHIWEADIDWNEKGLYHVSLPTMDGRYGDGKYNKVVDMTTRKTKILGLNIFPTMLNWCDIKIVMNLICLALQRIEEEKGNVFGDKYVFDSEENCMTLYEYVDVTFSTKLP